MCWHVLTRFPKARENVAERKWSRSEADTGQRTGFCFGLRLFFRRENRLRFSSRAGPSCWPELLRLYEPPGLRAGPLAHPQSAQPEPDRIGARLVAGLRALLSDEAELDRM